jgi:hypothetical protein
MLYYAIVGIVESILKLIVAIVVVYTFFDKLFIYGLLMASISLIIMIIMRIYCHRKYIECVIAPKKYFDKALMKEMTGFAGWSFLGSASSMIGHYGLGIVLNHFYGAILNAAHGIAGQLNGQLLVFSNTMMKALNPAIVKTEGGGERNNMLRMSLMGCKFSFFLFAVFTIPILLETQYILKIWLKDVPDWTLVFCRFYFAKTLIEQLTLTLDISISAQGNIKKVNIIKSLLSLSSLPLIFLLFSFGSPPYMMYVISIFFGSILGGIITIYFSIKNCNMNLTDYFKNVIYKSIVVFIFTFVFGSIPLFIMNDSFERFLIVSIMSIFSFFVTLFFIGLNSQEKSLIYMILISVRNKIRSEKKLIE